MGTYERKERERKRQEGRQKEERTQRKLPKRTDILSYSPPRPLPPHAIPYHHKRRDGDVLRAGPGLYSPRRQRGLDDALAIGADEALRQGDVVGADGAHAEGEDGGADADQGDGLVAGVVVEAVAEGDAVADEGDVGGVGDGDGRVVVVVVVVGG